MGYDDDYVTGTCGNCEGHYGRLYGLGVCRACYETTDPDGIAQRERRLARLHSRLRSPSMEALSATVRTANEKAKAEGLMASARADNSRKYGDHVIIGDLFRRRMSGSSATTTCEEILAALRVENVRLRAIYDRAGIR